MLWQSIVRMKNFFLTDKEIKNLITEPKTMGCPIDSVFKSMKDKPGREISYRQTSFKFSRTGGEGEWLIYLRHSKENVPAFSCGLKFAPKGRNQEFTLVRYNGKNHQHTNCLENENTFYDFHIHTATERYQQSPHDDEHYAQPTDRYADIGGAFKILLFDCKVLNDNSDNTQVSIF